MVVITTSRGLFVASREESVRPFVDRGTRAKLSTPAFTADVTSHDSQLPTSAAPGGVAVAVVLSDAGRLFQSTVLSDQGAPIGYAAGTTSEWSVT